MANLVLTNAFIWVNGVDLSSHVAELVVNRQTEMVDDSAMGETFRSFLTGLQTWSMEIEFHQDYESAAVHDTIWPILACNNVCFEIRPINVFESTCFTRLRRKPRLSSREGMRSGCPPTRRPKPLGGVPKPCRLR